MSTETIGGGASEARRPAAVASGTDDDDMPAMGARFVGEAAGHSIEIAPQRRASLRSGEEVAAFFARVPLGDDIPRDLYLALAQALVFAYEVSTGRDPSEGD